MTEIKSESKLYLGVAYYPEHWPSERWPEDIRLMKEAGITVVRMGEFAWSSFEPEPPSSKEKEAHQYNFDWLDQVILLLAEAGIVSILGTPSAAPPAWLTQKYPEILAVDEYGRRLQHGNRCHYCVNSSEYHAAVQRIVQAMAEHFGPNPNVIGWQIDNEFNRVCYCEHCRVLFQQFLQEKYGSLDELNKRWSTAYWSQTYTSWDQIPLPVGYHNPGLMLEHKHFITLSYKRFQKMQIDILRPHLPEGVWITHNFMGWYDGYDHYSLADDLDLVSWDWYVGTGHHEYLSSGAMHDLCRGFKRKNYWVMETQPGYVNWAPVNNTLNKGEARVMAWHAVAHGAEAVLYWQWRSAPGGQEQYHGTLLDASGQPRPLYEEVKQLGKEFEKLSPLLSGSKVPARVAILFDYDSWWSLKWQPHHEDFDYIAHLLHYYRPFARWNIPVDIISADAPLTGYSLVIAPALTILNDRRIENLKTFVMKGGRLVITIRSGVKDEYNALLPSRPPGPLSELTGVEVIDYFALEDPVPVKGNLFTGQSRIWAEVLQKTNNLATEVARYGICNGWLDNQIAVSVNVAGTGLVYYVGVYLDEAARDLLMDRVVLMGAVRPVLPSPPGVEVAKRVTHDGKDVYILINHENTEKRVAFLWPALDHITGTAGSGELRLKPYGIAVLTLLDIKK